MTEFVGLRPDGARELCTTMGDVLQQISPLKSALSNGISEAGSDYPSTARHADVLDRSGTFLTDSRRDLTWRVQTIGSVPGNTRTQDGYRTATFAFDNPEQARKAGADAGAKLKGAWDAYDKDPSGANWDAIMEALGAANATGDPEYSAGFLNGLTPEGARGVLFQWMERNKDPRGVGLTPAELEDFKKEMGPFIQAFTTADAAGLAPGMHKFIVESGGPDLITAMLAAAPQSKQFLLDAGQYLLWAATVNGVGGTRNWRLRWFLQAFSENPAVLQELLAKDPKNAELLLRPEVRYDSTPEVQALLVKTLEGVLDPATGTDAQRRAAFYNLTKVYANPAVWNDLNGRPDLKKVFVTALRRELDDPAAGMTVFQEVADIFAHSGKPPVILKDEQVNHIFTEHLVKYLPEISGLQAWRHDKDLASLNPGGAWDGKLSEDELATLIAGTFQRDEGRASVMAEFRKYLNTLDVGGGNLNDPADREKFTLAMATASGLGGLMVSGVHLLDTNAEDRRKLLVQVALMPVDAVVGRVLEPVGEIGGPGMSKLEDLITKDLDKDEGGWFSGLPVIGGWFKHGNEDGEASALAEALAKEQIDRYNQRLVDAGKPPLSKTDEVLLANAIEGFYFEPIVDALKQRGG
ncbi:hypothetical protein Psi02_36770 [Planotetraspora silvatica]|uniref:Uncharacterized protein n=1 Tax=Planotetraspora silvatica TaxID=234614 RepID=A0A8J3XSF5_9ACTN|nr:hypothetical protein [Planotetraspora silvatica]GII47253.1 hypothetical protein Psi02_36770 [Planotetraspora silvatica]